MGIVSVSPTADFLDKYAERTEDGVLHRELIGVYYNYQIEVGWSVESPAEYARLWSKLTEPVEFHTITLPDAAQGDITFTCYFSSVKHKVMTVHKGVTYWNGLSFKATQRSKSR